LFSVISAEVYCFSTGHGWLWKMHEGNPLHRTLRECLAAQIVSDYVAPYEGFAPVPLGARPTISERATLSSFAMAGGRCHG
jgi:hypothetical protein